MEIKVFEKLVKEEVLPDCFKIMDSKGVCYSGLDDKLGNFKRCGKLAGVSTEQAWLIYFMKHVDAISAYCRGEYSDCESIEGRIKDVINYAFLLYGIVAEKKAGVDEDGYRKEKEGATNELPPENLIMSAFGENIKDAVRTIKGRKKVD